MNFDLTEDQKMLVDTAASFAKKSSPVERHRKLRDDDLGFERKVWREMGELGWLGVMFPESVGGFGGRFTDAALVLEQLGKTLVPEPYIESVLLGGLPLLYAGDDAQHKALLAPLVAGESIVELAWAERQGRFDPCDVETRATVDGDGYSLTGEKVWALAGHAADTLVVSARTSGDARDRDGLTLFAVPVGTKGVNLSALSTMDGRRAAHVRFDGARIGNDAVLGNVGGGAQVLDRVLETAAAAACAEGLGIAQAVLDMTVEYLGTREQFGTKIGSFQVLQHRAVEMFIETELLRSITTEAIIRAGVAPGEDPDGDGGSERAAAVSAAKAKLSSGGRLVVREGVQLHGGIGITDEHDIGLYFKRMQVLTQLFGDEDTHLDRFSAQTIAS